MENLTFYVLKAAAPVGVIVLASLLRLLPHPANVAPIAAMALFGGCYLGKKYAFVLPLLALFLSDLVLGFHASMPFVYGSFVLTGILGIWLKKRKNAAQILFASLLSSTLFFLITNFGYWLSASLYPKTFAGQMQAYYFALPFFRNTLLGDLLYTGLFFGGFEVIRAMLHKRIPAHIRV